MIRLPERGRYWRLECGTEVVIPRVIRARGFGGRAIGLMGRRDLPAGTALWLMPCSAIHTCFMRFPLDVLFLGRGGTIVRVARDVRPWRWGIGARGAAGVIEARAGWLDPSRFPVGERVRLTPVSFGDAAVRGRRSRPLE